MLTLLCGLGVAGLLAGCGTAPTAQPAASVSPPAAAFPMTLEDCSEQVTLTEAPTAVMTIGSDAIALLDAAGASSKIVARAGEFGAGLPADLDDPPTDARIIDPSDPTTEQIIGSGADVVIGYGFFKADAAALADAGITTLTVSGECGHDGGGDPEPVNFDLVLGDITRFGAIFGTSAVAEKNVAGLRDRLTAVEQARPAKQRTAAAVYYFSSSAPMSGYGGLGLMQTMLTDAGLDNVYADQQKTYFEASLESLLAADPDVIVIAYGLAGDTFEQARERFLREPGVSDLRAVEAGRIVGVPGNETSASPASVTGLERLQKSVAGLSS